MIPKEQIILINLLSSQAVTNVIVSLMVGEGPSLEWPLVIYLDSFLKEVITLFVSSIP